MEILSYFPDKIINILSKNINNYKNIEEIRLRVNRPLILKYSNCEKITDYIVNTNEILEIMERITEGSLYSYQKQICEGYITLQGGHRVGIVGNVVMENEQVININYIYGLNFRIASQIIGVGKSIVQELKKDGEIKNTLIISPPGAGKTTLLRDIIRILSEEENIGVVDERGEIAAMYKNIPQNDIGLKVDILNNISKPLGIRMLVRSMAPDIICADEIGTKEDVDAIKYAFTSGVKGIFTAHGNSINDIKNNPILSSLLDTNIIKKVILLNKENRDKIKIIEI